ncbi:MAG: YdeI/OmpD-associated family protein [Candidatus Methanomethylophilaceae archaeon]|nr:YdeI/OmpD-associated family protein [Candidatus Methanomethylophilaceae archaeon]
MEGYETFYARTREEWRHWLSENFDKRDHIWFVFPMKSSGETSVSYNDAVEEALCFGWIDSTIKNLDDTHRIQRFTPRRKGSTYSRPNIERLIRMDGLGMIHPDVRGSVEDIIYEPYVFPEDIMDVLRSDPEVWSNFKGFSEPYKRIRIAYIDAARKRPEEFHKRLDSFVDKTRRNMMIRGFGGIDRYY